MVKDLSPNAVDMEQLAGIWRTGCEKSPSFPDPDDERWQNDTLYCDDLSFDRFAGRRDDIARGEALIELRSQLVTDCQDSANRFALLDSALSKRLICQYQDSALNPKVASGDAIRNAQNLLTRLPAVPLQIDLTSYLWGDSAKVKPLTAYLMGNTEIDDSSANPRSAWAQLEVVSREVLLC